MYVLPEGPLLHHMRKIAGEGEKGGSRKGENEGTDKRKSFKRKNNAGETVTGKAAGTARAGEGLAGEVTGRFAGRRAFRQPHAERGGAAEKPLFGQDCEIPSVRAYLKEAKDNRRGYF